MAGFLYHWWVNCWTKHQEELDIATFDGDTEIVIRADFAAQYQMKASHNICCDNPTTANQLVVLVLHSPVASGLRATRRA